MQFIIDLVALITLGLLFWKGWREGILVAIIGIARMFIAIIAAYFAGRYLGFWLGGVLNRPRIVMVPVTAGLTFVLVTFGLCLLKWYLMEKRHLKKEKGELKAAWLSGTAGGLLNAATGIIPMILVFWLCDIATTGITGQSIPGTERARFATLSRRSIYEVVYFSIAKNGKESQAAAIAKAISCPSTGIFYLKHALASPIIKSAIHDSDLAYAIRSGDASEIKSNRSYQAIFADERAREDLQELGIFARHETPQSFAKQLARLGENPNIRFSIQSLRERDMLQTENIFKLIRDPEFDAIVSEIMK